MQWNVGAIWDSIGTFKSAKREGYWLLTHLIVYNCKSDTTSLIEKDDIVISVTSFPKRHVTVAVMYGCTKDVMDDTVSSLKRLIRTSNLSAFHPLLLPVVYSELERTRLLNVLERKTSALDQRILEVENDLKQDEQRIPSSEESGITLAVRDCETTRLWRSVSKLKNSLQSLKAQLMSMHTHCMSLSQTTLQEQVGETDDYQAERESGDRIQTRLQEMIHEFDTKIRHCDSLLGGTALAAQMVSRLIFMVQSLYELFTVPRSGTIIQGETRKQRLSLQTHQREIVPK